jgi:ABC-type transport system substrate-binding protein
MLRYGNLDEGAGRSGLWRNYTLEANDGGVNQIDDLTIEFNLQFPSGAFIKFLAVDYVKVLPKHLLEQGIDLNLAEGILDNDSGSGPFVLDEYQRGNFYKVSKNEQYFKDGRPFFDSIDHFIITDPGTLIAQFNAGQIDMSNGGFTNLTPTQAAEIERDSNGAYRVQPVSPSADWGLMLNVKKAPFNDARVREAIQLAIDYQQWNDLVFDNTSGVGCPLMGLAHSFEECNTWPGLRPKDGPGGADDVARAKQLMADAGFPDGFDTRYDVRQVGTYPDQCSLIKQQLKETLGIDGDITTYPSAAGYSFFGTSREEGSEGDWEMACQGEGQVVLDVDGIMGGVYLKGATRNYTDWESDIVNEFFERQKVETDPAKRTEINKELELYLFTQQDNHWITMGWGVLEWIVSEDIQGFNAPQTVQTHFKHEDLWLDR